MLATDHMEPGPHLHHEPQEPGLPGSAEPGWWVMGTLKSVQGSAPVVGTDHRGVRNPEQKR